MRLASLSRRALLTGGACFACLGGSSRADEAPSVFSCDDVEVYPSAALARGEAERQTLYLLLAMALVFDGWTIDRSRPKTIAEYEIAAPGRVFPDYAGHNICALIVDEQGSIVSFGLNRNVALNSTLEHAEARAVRHAIARFNEAAAGGPKKWSFGDILRRHTLYTTLEPCAECAGIMDLANLEGVTFAEDDPAQFRIAAVIYNLQRRRGGRQAPLPIRADFFPLWKRLEQGYAQFTAGPAEGRGGNGATAFLQTVEAYGIYRDAALALEAFRPSEAANEAAVRGALDFRARSRPWIVAGVGPT